ncbi:MAG: class I SAM-dependent methyltransferase [Bacteroidetes bacterium]|nr:MAG: class I SAM-dependent methyltransferase [Bacteroidota bacterium]
MPHWLIKASVQKIISALPASQQLNTLLQRHVSGQLRLRPDFVADRLEHVSRHLHAYQEQHGQVPQRVLEIGTGWYPLVPLGLYLCGVSCIYSLDVQPLLQIKQLHHLLAYLRRDLGRKRLTAMLPGLLPQRLERLQVANRCHKLEQLGEALGLFFINGDARSLHFEDDHFDLIVSNNTFEHISPTVLAAMLPELQRVLRPGGIMSHYIDLVDHYSYFDSRLPAFHFLQYSQRAWKWIENPLQAQNRLRMPHYRELYRQAGIAIKKEINEHFPASSLPARGVHPDFGHIPPNDLLVAYTHIISGK